MLLPPTRCRRLALLVSATLLVIGLPAHGQAPKGKVVEDAWEAAYIDGVKSGHVHLLIEEIEQDGKKLLRATKELRLTLLRDGQRAEIKADVGSIETPEGEVVGVFMRHWSANKLTLDLRGTLQGKTMRVTVQGPVDNEREIPWNPKVVGSAQEYRLLRDRKAKPGDKIDYLYFEPTVNAIVTVRADVRAIEETPVGNGKPRKLLRVQVKPDRIQNVQLPASVQWVDPDSYKPIKTQSELPGLGTLTLVRTTREAALVPGGRIEIDGDLPDVIGRQSIRLSERIRDVHTANAVSYRIVLRSADAEVKGIVSQDARQQMRDIKGQSFVLDVEAVRSPGVLDPKAKKTEPGEEFLKSNHYINSDDARVRELARTAVNGETDPWKKAQRIERWVRTNMKPVDYSEALATADHVAKTLSGDCTEFAMLAAAMCRAQNIPSRTAIGLVYVDHPRHGPILAFHMWTEVFVKGQWLALDATLGHGSIGPGHIKITEHHWNEVRDFSPLLPVMGFILAKPSIEVISYRRSE
jgi:transglutaminase-like putative cysteine protease